MTVNTKQRWSALCFLLLVCLSLAQDPSSDRGILETFYYSCNGDNWNQRENWLDQNMSICDWWGVTCSSSGDEKVEMIQLPNNNVACSLPKQVFLLPELIWLDLRSNFYVTADFTSLYGHEVAKLEYLILADTDVDSLDGIEVFRDSLSTLYVGGCRLSGEIPEILFRMTALKHLDLSYNLLSGTLSDSISALQDLRTLGLSHNFLNGQIPEGLGRLSRLTAVQMQFNQLSGTLPLTLNDMYSLSFLTLNDQIQGPRDAQIGGMSGPLVDFSTLQFLFHVDLSNNRLSGTLPSNLLDSLLPGFGYSTVLDLRSNELGGEVPMSLMKFESILAYLADNQIESVPIELCQQVPDWLFGQVGQYGCNAILCPPGTFNSYGRQMSDGFPCWACRTGETAPYFGSQRCEATSTALTLGGENETDANDIWSFTHIHSPFGRLSKDTNNRFDGYFWRDGLDNSITIAPLADASLATRAAATGAVALLSSFVALTLLF